MNKSLDCKVYDEQSLELHRSEQYDKAIILCKRILTRNSRHYDAHFQWGLSHLDNYVYNKAERKYKEVLLMDPTNFATYHNLGMSVHYQNRLLEAEILYKKSLERELFRDTTYNLAIVLTKLGKYTEALEQNEKNIKNYPNDSPVYSSHGYLQIILGKYEEAIQSFEKALSIDSGNILAFLNKSIALHCLGKTELAIEVFQNSFVNVEDWQKRFQKYLGIYKEDLSRFEQLFESDDLGEITREKLEINIKALHFIIDLVTQELTKPLKDKDQ